MNDIYHTIKKPDNELSANDLSDLDLAHRSALFDSRMESPELVPDMFTTCEEHRREYRQRRSDNAIYTRPTPFADFPEGLLTRDGEEQLMLEQLDLVNAGADAIGLINPEKLLLAAKELSTQRIWLTRQNVKSYKQLMDNRDIENETPGITAIINNAGVSIASMKDMAELLYVYPEAISGEFFDFVKPFDTKEIIRGLNILRAQLQNTAKNDIGDVIIGVDFDERKLEETYDARQKIYVTKTVIGTIYCKDGSGIEAVAKTTEIPLHPDDFSDKARIEGPQRIPLSVAAYLRRSDYKERRGYVSPEEAQGCIDVLDADTAKRFGQVAGLDTVSRDLNDSTLLA